MSPITPEAAPDAPGVVVRGLNFAYPNCKPFISNFNLDLPRGSRCLLLGANGAGKTTLLQILAGKYMVGEDVIRVIGRPPFHDLALTCDGDLSYLGSQWRRDIATAGSDVALQGDIAAGTMIYGVDGVDPARRSKLMHLLDIDPRWNMNRVSDGQRRRVQICLGLLKPYQVLLLDEITVDMDVVGRLELLEFFREETEERGATIIYATHIFDGLEPWITHVAFVSGGELVKGGTAGEVLGSSLAGGKKLLRVVEAWLAEEKERLKDVPSHDDAEDSGRAPPMLPNKHLAYFR
ncbi:unnamed protein product [Pedinophyceae sp. YPF-701]|nr:unnamed protein product [Pedinophyceae sp. YPF-701]